MSRQNRARHTNPAGHGEDAFERSRLDLLQDPLERTRDDVAKLQTELAVIRGELRSIATQRDRLISRAGAAEKPEWPKWSLMAMLFGLILGPASVLLTLYINGSVLPLKNDIAQIATAITGTKAAIRDIAIFTGLAGKPGVVLPGRQAARCTGLDDGSRRQPQR